MQIKFKLPISYFFFASAYQQRGEKRVWLIYSAGGLRREEGRLIFEKSVDFDFGEFPPKEGKKQVGGAKCVTSTGLAWGIPPYLFVSYLIVSFSFLSTSFY